jgi:tetratricopeptide (TPR) repeat protein
VDAAEPTLLDLLARQERALDHIGDRAAQTAALERLLLAAAPAGQAAVAAAELRRAHFLWATNDFQAASIAAQAALTGYDDLDDAAGIAEAHRQLGRIAREVSDFAAAHRHFDTSLEYLPASHLAARANLMVQKGSLLSEEGAFEAALRSLRNGHALAVAAGSDWDAAWALDNLSIVHAIRGDYGAALEAGRAALDLARRIGAVFREMVNSLNLGGILAFVGAYDEAAELTRRALDLSRDLHDAAAEAQALVNLGEVLGNLARPGEATEALAAGIALARSHDRHYLEAAGWIALSEVQLAMGQPTEAAASARSARRVAEAAPGMEGQVAVANAALAAALDAAGAIAAALAASAEAVAALEAGVIVESAEEKIYFARYLALRHADRDGAQAALAKAKAHVAERQRSITDPDLQRSYREGVPLVRRILEAS